jgi:hypothetical protein
MLQLGCHHPQCAELECAETGDKSFAVRIKLLIHEQKKKPAACRRRNQETYRNFQKQPRHVSADRK